MDKLFEKTGRLRKVSNRRPKSLILPIPSDIRDIMEFEHATEVKLVAYARNERKILEITKKD